MHKLFAGQSDEEKIYLVVREHWVYFAQKMFFVLFFFSLYIFAKLWGVEYVSSILSESYVQTINIILNLYLLVLILATFILWVLYYLNVQIITDVRIVDVDQVGLFFHTSSELNIEKIEDVTSEIGGIFGTIFNYGNVLVQTAGSTERFEFSNVPHPAQIQKLIHDLYEKANKANEKQP